MDSTSFLFPLVSDLLFIIGYCIIMSCLLIAEIPLMALKFKDFSWSNNKYRYLLGMCSVIALIVLRKESIPVIMVAYILFSLLQNKTEKN